MVPNGPPIPSTHQEDVSLFKEDLIKNMLVGACLNLVHSVNKYGCFPKMPGVPQQTHGFSY